ncbi:MAG: sigma-70 family RNA polymerase sigma factor, partial [Pirellula sp.]
EVARTVGSEVNRSTETIRYTIKNFDRQYPKMAVFPDQRELLSQEDRRAMYQQHHRGVSTVILAKRYGRTRTSIVRLLNEERAARVMELVLDYIPNAEFEDESLTDEILGEMPVPSEAPRKVRAPSGLPTYLASLYDVPLLNREQEYHLFRKMNFLKHTASKLRSELDVKAPLIALMDRIENLYEQSVAVKNKIVQSNLRLVVSIAKKHVDPSDDFFGLISDGNMSLIRACEKFDYSRGNKFSTYASWAIMKNFARTIPDEFRHRDRFRTSSEEIFTAHQDQRADNFTAEIDQASRTAQIQKILHTLDQREQQIIVRRFGLDHRFEPLTLKEVGEELGVTKERIRQLETRALDKLRLAAAKAHIDIPE